MADRQGLSDLQEAAEQKMTSIYVYVYEREKCADQLFSLPSRDIEVCVKYRK